MVDVEEMEAEEEVGEVMVALEQVPAGRPIPRLDQRPKFPRLRFCDDWARRYRGVCSKM